MKILKSSQPDQVPVGKLSPELLQSLVLSLPGAKRPEVVVGPEIGEDAAVIDLSEIRGYLVVASDPVVGASAGAGKLLVTVNVNDVACKGADPAYFMVTLLSPQSRGLSFVDDVMKEIDHACRNYNISIVGGHTEITDRYEHPVISGTMIGVASSSYSAGSIRPKDVVLMTGHAALEGMSILGNDRPDLLAECLATDEIAEVASWAEDLCIYPESLLVRDLAKYMHDPTEGGVLGGITEVGRSCGLGFDLYSSNVPVHHLTGRAAKCLDFDPGHMISSGVLLAVLDPKMGEDALQRFRKEGIKAEIIGEFTEGRGNVPFSAKEELWRVLDMDLSGQGGTKE